MFGMSIEQTGALVLAIYVLGALALGFVSDRWRALRPARRAVARRTPASVRKAYRETLAWLYEPRRPLEFYRPAEQRTYGPARPMPGPENTAYTPSKAVMECYDRLWNLCLIRAERKLHGVVALP